MSTISLPIDRTSRWIFLSPHLDDAVFSCGGLISYLSEKKIPVEVWTIFSDQDTNPSNYTAYARSLHDRWQTGEHAYVMRKKEDAAACQTLGVSPVNLGYHDVIYRFLPDTGEPVVSSDAELFSAIKPGEQALLSQLAGELRSRVKEPSIWVCPLGLGQHVDHVITRQAAESTQKLLLYYADLPYGILLPVQSFDGMIQLAFNLPDKNVQMWAKAILQYSTQVSTFWKNAKEMASQYSAYLEKYKGMPLWLPKPAEMDDR